MKRFIPLLGLFAAGVVVSFAIAAPPPGHGNSTTTSEHGKSHGHGNAKCHPLNMKGKVAGGAISFDVTKASARSHLSGSTAILTVSGNVSVQVWSCGASGSAGGAQTLYLKQLHVGGSPHSFGTTTTTG